MPTFHLFELPRLLLLLFSSIWLAIRLCLLTGPFQTYSQAVHLLHFTGPRAGFTLRMVASAGAACLTPATALSFLQFHRIYCYNSITSSWAKSRSWHESTNYNSDQMVRYPGKGVRCSEIVCLVPFFRFSATLSFYSGLGKGESGREICVSLGTAM